MAAFLLLSTSELYAHEQPDLRGHRHPELLADRVQHFYPVLLAHYYLQLHDGLRHGIRLIQWHGLWHTQHQRDGLKCAQCHPFSCRHKVALHSWQPYADSWQPHAHEHAHVHAHEHEHTHAHTQQNC